MQHSVSIPRGEYRIVRFPYAAARLNSGVIVASPMSSWRISMSGAGEPIRHFQSSRGQRKQRAPWQSGGAGGGEGEVVGMEQVWRWRKYVRGTGRDGVRTRPQGLGHGQKTRQVNKSNSTVPQLSTRPHTPSDRLTHGSISSTTFNFPRNNDGNKHAQPLLVRCPTTHQQSSHGQRAPFSR